MSEATRTYLRAGASVAMMLLLVGCGTAEEPAKQPVAEEVGFARPDELTIGYLPIIYMTQIAGASEMGWLNELGVDEIEFQRFTSGKPMLQAIAAGEVDIGYIGAGPVITAGHQGLPVVSVAATSKDAMAFVATEQLAAIYASTGDMTAAVAEFEQQHGRRLRIGTVPRGTTPDVFLRMWLTGIGVDPEGDVEIVPMGSDQLVAAMVSGQVDGAVYGEPQITLIQNADPNFTALLYGRDLVPDLPGGVVMVQQSIIDQYPEMVQKLVEIHMRANRLFNDDPEFFAQTATNWLGEEFLPLEVALQAVNSPASNMVTNHKKLADTLAVYDQFLVDQGVWPEPLQIEDVFEYRMYEAVAQQFPELAD